MASRYAQRTWWTRERVLTGLRRFQREKGVTPLNTHTYHALVKSNRKGPERRYPSHYGVLRHFRTFREAWTAAGAVVNRTHEDWSELEDWYLREAAGLISRNEIACDLNRTPNAVHRRLYDLGLHSYRLHGWSLYRTIRTLGITAHRLRQAMESGRLPFRRGSKSFILNPADVVLAFGQQIDWGDVTAAVQSEIRRALVRRLVRCLY